MADQTPGSQDPATAAGAPPADTDKSPEELRSEIAEAREDLGETVEQLAAKADVKTRAQDAVEEGKGQLRHAADRVQATAQQKRAEGVSTDDVRGAAQAGVEQAKANPALAIAAGVGAALLVILILRRRSN
jgi:di/tripeptidase